MKGFDSLETKTQTATPPKSVLRGEALARRDAMPAAERVAAVEVVVQRPFPVSVKPGTIVSGYSPMKSEFNPVPLMRKLGDAGASLALPVTPKRGNPLIMRAWAFGDEMASGVWGIREPRPESPEVFPDIMLVPLAAFDRNGHRIGYGAGYYDMTIARIRGIKPVIAIGVAFAAQEIPRVPATAFDARLDLVLTELETIDFRS
ncbi:5-formyltetrahydrofolate cyclo-ligase [Pseudorhodoplanes sinuspersici]|uniref:5-formyltetrahydrofolate cyclo-ligase n=1 Tax=Pseudorhodoplanes sinuspersici TaxID=1235591 RepID=A0A1W6ZM15_9HYPH|nr:5-formyltetrahydrofolate cyclo-ligase [Pseudorhodoplanes sinuspersici]ARP98362.1 5-formyltetrahydrofolate cyclo-ligase [Pseudorhodoplanes sinuspersici]RKE66025.1 5-formyltetrahydrofolate cyclo-ligase [Pseudorhodoplanes sinuspersici]